MQRCAIILILFISTHVLAVSSLDEAKSVIIAPSISSKCQTMLDQRAKKIEYRQKMSALIDRNIKLQHQKIEDPKIKKKLLLNLRRLRNEYILIKDQIRYITNEIVQTGCPGIQI